MSESQGDGGSRRYIDISDHSWAANRIHIVETLKRQNEWMKDLDDRSRALEVAASVATVRITGIAFVLGTLPSLVGIAIALYNAMK